MTPNPKSNTELTYFGIQSEWGVTKHFGGLRATQRLAALTHIAAGQTVLEIGCGTGMGACHLAQTYGCRVVGVDLNAKMVAWAQKRAVRKGLTHLTEFRVADAQELPFEAATFDVALCESVTAFVPDKPRALREYTRVVRPGGYVALNEGTWVAAPPPALLEFVQRTMGGVDFQTAEAWQALVAGAGLALAGCEVEPLNNRQQRRDEIAGLDRQDWLGRLRAMGVIARLYLTNPDFRAYLKTLVPSRQVMRDMFTYLGYGLYVGKKSE